MKTNWYKNKYFPIIFQSINLIILFGLLFWELVLNSNHANSGNFIIGVVWFIWWPLFILSSLISIRLWCSICPMRLISEKTGSFSIKAKLPLFILKNRFYILAILIFLVHSIIQSYTIDNSSSLTSYYLLFLIIYIIVLSFIFDPQYYCKVFCPLNGIISMFSKMGRLSIRRLDAQECITCNEVSCLKNCPVKLSSGVHPSNDCLLCSKCTKVCPKNNLDLHLYRFSEIKPLSQNRNKGELFLVVILFGIALFEVIEFIESINFLGHGEKIYDAIMGIPYYLVQNGLPEQIFGKYNWLINIWIIFVIPSLLFLITYIFMKFVLKNKEKINLDKLIPFIFIIFAFILIRESILYFIKDTFIESVINFITLFSISLDILYLILILFVKRSNIFSKILSLILE